MANNIIKRVWNQNKMVNIDDLTGFAFQNENGGHTFEISGIDDSGAAVSLSGTVAGVFRRPDNADIALTGSASDGKVYVTLNDDCYAIPGAASLAVFVTSNSQKVAVYAAVLTVAQTSGGGVAGSTPQDVVDLINAINAAVATIPASYTDLMAAIAPTYSPSGLYPVGFYVWYDGDLYRCTTPITTAETWTAEHWTQVALASDVSSLTNAFFKSATYTDWEVGGINPTGGTNVPNSARIRLSKFVGINNNVASVRSITGYEFAVFAWDNSTGAYVGTYTSSGAFTNGGTAKWMSEFNFAAYPEYKFNVVLRNATSPSAEMSVSDGSNAAFSVLRYDTDKLFVKGYPNMVYNDATAQAYFGPDKNADNAPVNTFNTIGQIGLGITNLPGGSNYTYGTLFTFVFDGNQNRPNSFVQLYVTNNGINTRWKLASSWSTWTDNAEAINASIAELRKLSIKGYPNMVYNDATAQAYFGPDKNADNAPVNTFNTIGQIGLGITNLPGGSNYTYGTLFTFVFDGNQNRSNSFVQLYVTNNGINTRWKLASSWSTWTDNAEAINASIAELRKLSIKGYPNMVYSSAKAEEYFGSGKDADNAPVNTFAMIGALGLGIQHLPADYDLGNLFTYVFDGDQNRVNSQLQIYVDKNGISTRIKLNEGWSAWVNAENAEEVYYVGPNETYTSFTDLLIDLRNNDRKKVIYVREGTYDVFAEYKAAITAGKLQEPPTGENWNVSEYFYPLNAFVPNNTRVVGIGNVVLSWKPTPSQITYEESRTWAPLNTIGNVEIENLTVDVKNGRYCLHNDDKTYVNCKQTYKNCRFLYEIGDLDSQDRRLGLSCTIGFGLSNGCVHEYDSCEFYNTGYTAFYGHNATVVSGVGGSIIVRNCIIHSDIFGSNGLIRLQTLTKSPTQPKIYATFENCYINGNLDLNMYYTNSLQGYETTFNTCNTVTVNRTIASGGTIIDPYTVRQYNPLPSATSQAPQYTEDEYNA